MFVFVKDIAELYRIVYFGPEDHLRGAIVVRDAESGFQFLFKDNSLDTYGPKDVVFKIFRSEGQMEADQKSNPTTQPLIKNMGHNVDWP